MATQDDENVELSQEEILAAVFGTSTESVPGRMGNAGTPADVKAKVAAGVVEQGIVLAAAGALKHTGTTVGFYGVTPVARPAALTAAVATATTSTDGAVIDNLRTRLNELETRLRSLGLLT